MTNTMTDNNRDFLFAEADCCIDSIMLLPEGSRLFATNYAAEDLCGSNKAVADAAKRAGLYVELPLPDDLFIGFMKFGAPYRASMSYGQISALFNAKLSPTRFTLVSRSPLLIAEARKLGIRAIDPSQLPMANPAAGATLKPVFQDAIDERKVFSQLRIIRDAEGSPLLAKAYWIVPWKIFNQYEWTCCTQKAFMERVSIEFNLNPAITPSDMKYAVKMIKAKEDFQNWGNSPYRDFGCTIFNVFFGDRLPWGASGRFVYEHEREFMKQNRFITHAA